LAPRAASLLRERGITGIHVSEIGMSEAEDTEILAQALTSNRICVTLDHDFHTHLAVAGGPQ
jgi:predicted nuclease of predicted toxin-antitoxin system